MSLHNNPHESGKVRNTRTESLAGIASTLNRSISMDANHLRRQRDRRILEVLYSLNYQSGDLKSYLQQISIGVSELIEVDYSVVTFCRNGYETILASSDPDDESDSTYSLHGTVTETVVNQGVPIVVEDATSDPALVEALEPYRAYLGVPLRIPGGEIIGTVCSFHERSRPFTDEEVQLAELFAERAAMAIANYQLYQQQQQINAQLQAEINERQLAEAERRKSEQEMLKALATLAEVGELASMIIHEIRNPLTTILMGLNSFKKIDLPETAQERLALSLSEAERLQQLLREILLYAKPQTLQCEKFELNSFISDLLGTLHTMPSAQNRHIEFISSSTALEIFADKNKLKQVFTNLIDNACEAVSEGHVITWRVEHEHPYILIQIHNGGEPIPAEVLSELTKPFYTTKPFGTGLGLAIVKRIIEAHGGIFSIESSVAGTTVSIRLAIAA